MWEALSWSHHSLHGQAGDCLRPQQEGGRLQQHDSVPCPALGRSSSARARAAEAKALAVKVLICLCLVVAPA